MRKLRWTKRTSRGHPPTARARITKRNREAPLPGELATVELNPGISSPIQVAGPSARSEISKEES